MTTQQTSVKRNDWHPRTVLGALEHAGYTLNSLAKELGLSSGVTLSRAVRHGGATGEARIAKVLGLHPKEIWPSRYNEDGTRKLSGYRRLTGYRTVGPSEVWGKSEAT